MCYSPITIVNPTKYVSLKYRDRFLLQVPCGKCAQCQQQKSNEWYYRSYIQTLDTFASGGYVVFDTLTYSNHYLPHMSDFFDVSNDYPCFNSHHTRTFIARLRQRCKRQYNSNFTYFLSSEYGTDIRKSHRPHYHCLFYVVGNIKPLDFSRLVAECWHYGRTDGYPWKPARYVLSNIFSGDNFDASLRTCRYVSKYVQKSCVFQSEIDRRIQNALVDYARRNQLDYSDWCDSVDCKELRMAMRRSVNQFHRQSTQFGASVLANIDLNDLFSSGSLFMPDANQVVKPIGLPTYYKRKLFYELVEVDGCRTWQPTELGREYLAKREMYTLKRLIDRYDAVCRQYHYNYDCGRLADYVLNYRGRIKGDNAPSTLADRLQHVDYFNYSTLSDRKGLGKVGISVDWLGNHIQGYHGRFRKISHYYFARRFTYEDSALERQLEDLNARFCEFDTHKQESYRIRQRLTNLYRYLGI